MLYEPLAIHPLAVAFRFMTPTMLTPHEHPLRPRDFRVMRKHFRSVSRVDFGLATPLSAGVALIPGLLRLAKKTLPVCEFIDSAPLKVLPVFGNLCLYAVARLTEPRI